VTLGIGLAAASLTGLASAALSARIGRRETLAIVGMLMALTGLDLAYVRVPALLVLAGVTGMLGASSVDYGPFSSVEQAVLAETATPARRNRAFARYALTGGLFNAAGGLFAALLPSTQAYFVLYAVLGAASAVLPLFMSSDVEGVPTRIVFGSFRPLAGLAALFALDSLGGGSPRRAGRRGRDDGGGARRRDVLRSRLVRSCHRPGGIRPAVLCRGQFEGGV